MAIALNSYVILIVWGVLLDVVCILLINFMHKFNVYIEVGTVARLNKQSYIAYIIGHNVRMLNDVY